MKKAMRAVSRPDTSRGAKTEHQCIKTGDSTKHEHKQPLRNS